MTPLNLDKHVVTDKSHLDLGNAKLDQGLSRTGMNPETQSFYATTDRLAFQSLLHVVQKVLESQNFHLNLENILGALEQSHFGLALSGRTQTEGRLKVERALPALSVRLPQRGLAGPLLSLYYEQLQSLEDQITLLKATGEGAEAQKAVNTILEDAKSKAHELQEAKTEIQRLRELLNNLEAELAIHRAKVVSVAVSDQVQSLNSQLSPGKLETIHWPERALSIRTERGLHRVFMAECSSLAALDSPCIYDHERAKPFFYLAKEDQIRYSLAEVLEKQESQFRCRTFHRRLLDFRPLNATEETQFQSFKVGSAIILHHFDGEVFRFSPLTEDQGIEIFNRIREQRAILKLKALSAGKAL